MVSLTCREFCEDGSLADQLSHGRIDSEEVIMMYAYQMLQGLQYLHAKVSEVVDLADPQHIEHRDVKPENILMTRTALKFVDFGAAKVIQKRNQTMAKTRALKTKGPGEGPAVMNSLAGTPMYMAPEVIKPNDRPGALGAADIWSMGCVLLECATGRKPWSNLDNEWAIMFTIGIATQHPPLPENGELSDAGIAFLRRCLTLEPSLRPDASTLLEDPWLQGVYDQFEVRSSHDIEFALMLCRRIKNKPREPLRKIQALPRQWWMNMLTTSTESSWSISQSLPTRERGHPVWT